MTPNVTFRHFEESLKYRLSPQRMRTGFPTNPSPDGWTSYPELVRQFSITSVEYFLCQADQGRERLIIVRRHIL
jgi:hypothetical protein